MRKQLALLLAGALIVGAFGAPSAMAGKKKKKPAKPVKTERVAEGTYDAPSLLIAGTCSATGAVGCVALPAGVGERYVSAVATDAHGQAIFVSVQADTNGDSMDDVVYGDFCGETSEPLLVDEGTELHFWVGVTPDPALAGCVPAAATQGKVTVTFSNMP